MYEAIVRPPWPQQGLHELVADQAQRTPDRVAVQSAGRRLTYRELVEAADRVAAALVAGGAGPGRMVAVMIDRSVELPVALLGVLKSGAAFVPVDPAYPPQRQAYMLDDSGAETTLTVTRLADRATTKHVVTVDDLPAGAAPPTAAPVHDDLAYLMYTSGSTGRPKGVAVDHRCLVKGVLAMGSVVRPKPDDVWLSVTSASFDPVLVELFLPLVHGNSVVLAGDQQVLDGEALRAVLTTSRVTVLQATPLAWRMLLEAGWKGPLRVALCGGETLAPPLAAELAARCAEVWNSDGPTETTVWSTAHRVTLSDRPVVPVGRPLPDTTVHILDEEMRPVAPVAEGGRGEVWISGGGVARGYHRKPELTAERFMADPFGTPGSRLYRTGDLGRLRADGALELLGRADHQVKLHGHRVELGEIESWLQEHPSVTGAVAVAGPVGGEGEEHRLVGYVSVRQGHRFDEPELRAHAAIRLPRYMVPGTLVPIEVWPRTPSGKIDRSALPEPPAPTVGVASRPEAGDWGDRGDWDDDTTRVLAGIWQELLGVAPPGPKAHFFGLGGHSLQVMRMVGRIRAEFGVRINAAQMMLSPTLAEQAALVRAARTTP
jgi:amino acid adenylation domain-containing protein